MTSHCHRRNAILAAVSRSLDRTHSTIALLEEFAENFQYDPHGKHMEGKGGVEWLTAVGELKELEEEEHGEASTSADCFDALIEHDLDVDAALRQLSRRRR